MAWASAAVPAAELTAEGLDKPCLVTSNAARAWNALPQWSISGTWSDSGPGEASNVSYSNAPPYWAYDGKGTRRTYPVGGVYSTFFYMMDLALTGRNDGIIDSIAILGHNFDSLPGNLTISVSIADDEDFSVNLQTIHTFNLTAPHDPTRLVALLATRYTDVQYARLNILSSVNFSTTVVPRIGELILGRRRQLARNPDEPTDDRSVVSRVAVLETQNGDDVSYVQHKNRREIEPFWTADENDTIDDKQTWIDFFDDLDGGTRPFLYLRNPTTTPADAPLMYLPEPRDFQDHLGPYHAEVSHEMKELPPFYRDEVLSS